MTIQKIVDYVFETPFNTNRIILTEMLKELQGNNLSIENLDEGCLVLDKNGKITLAGFDTAEAGQSPYKDEEGKLAWRTLSDVALTGNIEDLKQNEDIAFYGGSATEILGGN